MKYRLKLRRKTILKNYFVPYRKGSENDSTKACEIVEERLKKKQT
jgi:hypothetical protein